MRPHHPHVLLVLLAYMSLGYGKDREGCSFRNNGCVYNINLAQSSNANGNADRIVNMCGGKEATVDLDRAQNDYTSKIEGIEKNFSFLRDAHETRIKELESTVRALLGLDDEGKGSAAANVNENVGTKDAKEFKLFNFNNEALMEKLQVEFNNLRDDIKQKGEELIDTRIKLNETHVLMHEAQLQIFRTSKDLMSAENQITMLKRERAILKNQVKDKAYRLSESSKKEVACQKKSDTQQGRVISLFRSESTLKEGVMTIELQLNETKDSYERIKVKHRDLKTRHERVKKIMRIREKELIQCYSAKTNTFCGFEDPNLCGFTDIADTSDFFDWTWGQGKTPSSNTGPTGDHTCQGPHGHFMYIEASAKGRGNNAILYSPLYRGMDQQCVEFFYNMHGRHVGTLNVYAKARGDVLQSAWRAYGNQGDYWTNARLAIPKELAMAGYQIAFEGITESGYQGDMAIDDVSVTDGPCPVDESVVPIAVAINSTSVIKEGKSFARKLRRKMRNKRHLRY